MWHSRTKIDLIIEVWEKLECESVGAAEIEAIEEAVSARFGEAAVESPMRIARILADEGAALRHAEIMQLWVRRFADRPHEAEFRNLIRTADLDSAARSIKHLENLRRKFISLGDKEGLRLLREEVLDVKAQLQRSARNNKKSAADRHVDLEITEWLTIWLQSPELFENWIKLRRGSAEYNEKFLNAH
jgi:hypothetical protein